MKQFRLSLFFAISLFISGPSFAQTLTSFHVYNETKNKLEASYLLKEALGLSNLFEFRLINDISPIKDEMGFQHERYKQYYNNIIIENSDIIVHKNDDNIISANGECLKRCEIDTTNIIGLREAIYIVKNHVNAKYKDIPKELVKIDSTMGLVIFVNEIDSTVHLSYKIKAFAMDFLISENFYIDAHTGSIISYASNIFHEIGVADTRFSGEQTISTHQTNSGFILKDMTRGHGVETRNLNHSLNFNASSEYIDDDNHWTASEYHNSNRDDGALDAHWGAMMTYDYFKQVHARNSYDGNDSKLKNYVHARSPYYLSDNAAWIQDSNCMIYIDGYYLNNNILSTLDIVGHEIGHGICQYSAKLKYKGESGAINESLSDIWGACIEAWATNDKQTYVCGEDLGTPIRNMANPKIYNNPDTYGGSYWKDPTDTSYDHGGVHCNSGVMNYWFYLLSEGGSGTNDKGWNYSVSGITMNKAAKIVYRAETVYMTQNTNFINVREYTIAAAKDIYGSNSQEVQSVKDAWYAVGVWADLYIRDSVSDNGLVPSNVHYMWESPDIWIEDLDGNVGNPHGNSICNVCVRIWNRNDIVSSGKERLFINWAKAGCDLQWDLNWTGSAHFPCGDNPVTGGVVGSANGMLIQSIPAHGSTVVRIPWVTPMAEDYQNCTQFNAELWHFCLVARIHDGKDIVGESSAPGGMGNFVNDNNNVAWKNISILDAQYNTAVVSFSNPFDFLQRFRLHFRTRPNKAGDIIFKHADVLIRLDDELVRLWKDGGGVCVGGRYLGENRFLVQEPDFYLENIVMPIDRHYTVEAGVRFFTQTTPLCNEFEFDIIEEGEKEIIGGEHYLAIKDSTKRFKAIALENKTVLAGDSTSFTAQAISEDAQYTWFSTVGDTLAIGDLLQTSQNTTRQYILEVVSIEDNYKDVDTVTVTVRRAAITALTPNPANNQTIVSYRLASDVTSASIVIANATGQVLYSAPLDVTQTAHTVNLQAIPTGQYTVRIESQGSPLDSKTLIVY